MVDVTREPVRIPLFVEGMNEPAYIHMGPAALILFDKPMDELTLEERKKLFSIKAITRYADGEHVITYDEG